MWLSGPCGGLQTDHTWFNSQCVSVSVVEDGGMMEQVGIGLGCGCIGRTWWDDGASGERAGVRVYKKNCIESVRNSATGNKKQALKKKKTMMCNVNNNEANIQ